MGKRIIDEFSKVPSRQRRWQLRQMAQGRCRICGRPGVTVKYCKRHRDREAAKRRSARITDRGAIAGHSR